MLAPLIFIGVADDRKTTFADVDSGLTDPSQRARGLLDEHRSCQSVEVWREDDCIAGVSRRGAGPTA